MDRRSFLAVATTFGGSTLAGCSARGGDGRPGSTPTRPAASRFELPVPESELHRSARRDEIPAITDPAFAADWSGVELSTRTFAYEFPERTYEYTIRPRLEAEDVVVGVEFEGVARAYPLRILNWHEVVNDVVESGSDSASGVPLLVTYCPLCDSGVVAERTVDGRQTPFGGPGSEATGASEEAEPSSGGPGSDGIGASEEVVTSFGVSGLLWRANLVLYDRLTGSLWSQLRALAIRGPATGTELSLLPSRTTTWGEWTRVHPDSEVLLPPPLSNTVAGREATRDYNRNPYFGYESTRRAGVGYERFEDDRLHPKTTVLGVSYRGTARAYPLPAVLEAGVVNDTVGGLPVVVAADRGDRLTAYDRRVDGRVSRFSRTGPDRLVAGGSAWEVTTGRAVGGPHHGSRLRPVTERSPMFWFAWADLHPETEVFGGADRPARPGS